MPVFVPMTSWDPDSDTLRAWLEKQLPIHYPGLGTIISSGGERKSRIAILLDKTQLPISRSGYAKLRAVLDS